jgi:CRP/FNR family transcriptional regulator, cyclic AMP receptor protein
MGCTTTDFLRLPLFHCISPAQMESFLGHFTRVEIEPGTVLFEAGDAATHLRLLVSGGIKVSDDEGERLALTPPAVLGELGVVTGLERLRTAISTEGTEILQIERDALLEYLSENAEFSFRFQQNLLSIVGDKVARDQGRIADMRSNIVRTQKSMKQLRTYVLQELETPISEDVHDTLDELIGRNRRVNYRVSPPRPLAIFVRTDSGETHPISAMSRTRLTTSSVAASQGTENAWKGVLVLPDLELPLHGVQSMVDEVTLEIEFEEMIDEYATHLEDYLTRAQSLDILF